MKTYTIENFSSQFLIRTWVELSLLEKYYQYLTYALSQEIK